MIHPKYQAFCFLPESPKKKICGAVGSWVFAAKGHVSARAQPPLLVEAPGAASQLVNGLCLQHIITHTLSEITDKYINISSLYIMLYYSP